MKHNRFLQTHMPNMKPAVRRGAILLVSAFLLLASSGCGQQPEFQDYRGTSSGNAASDGQTSSGNQTVPAGQAELAQGASSQGNGKSEDAYAGSDGGISHAAATLLRDTPSTESLTEYAVPPEDTVQTHDMLLWLREGSQDSARKLQQKYPKATVLFNAMDRMASVAVSGALTEPEREGLTLTNASTPIDYLSRFGNAAVLLNLGVYDSIETQYMMQYIFGMETTTDIGGKGSLIRINLGDANLFAYAPAKDKPVNRIAFTHRMTPQEAVDTFVSCIDMQPVTAPFSISEPRLIMKNAWEYYEMAFRKTTPNGEADYLTAYVPIFSDGRGFAPDSTTWLFVPEYNRYIVSVLKDPDPKQTLTLKHENTNTLLTDYVSFTPQETGLLVASVQPAAQAGETSQPVELAETFIPYPPMLLKNHEEISKYFIPDNLMRIDAVNTTGNTATYRLKSLFGWDYADFGNQTERVYSDVAMVQVTFNEAGMPDKMLVTPKYTEQQAKSRKYYRVEDMGIGPFKLGMESSQLLRLAEQAGASVSGDSIRTLTYQGISFSIATNIRYVNGLSYAGSPENHKTANGIGIGATTAEVQNAYGLPDIGMEGDAVWQYMLYLSDAPLDSTVHDTHRLRFTFQNGLVSRIDMTANVGM